MPSIAPRPRLLQRFRRAYIFRVRLRASERRIIEQAARQEGMSMADFMRAKILASAPSARDAAELGSPPDHLREEDHTSSRFRRRGSR